MVGAQQEVETHPAAIHLVRDGRVASDEFYATRDEALEAAGLSDWIAAR
jgi:hypothetical protein